MMKASEEVVLVYDCGSTNLRVAAVNVHGDIVAQENASNSSKPQPGGKPGWMIWDLDEIWMKLCRLTRRLLEKIRGRYEVKAVVVTTWGADGVLVRKNGELVYPAISWQCSRTMEILNELRAKMDSWEIFKITGYQLLPFNTLLKWIWMRKHVPKALDEAYTSLMMPCYFSYKLTGEFFSEPTTGSTTMAIDSAKRDWSPEMLDLAGLDPSFFPEWKEPGDIAGYVSEKASNETGLKKGLPLVVGGHDTQFAIMAANAEKDEAILSSGTWEILALRINQYTPSRKAFEQGVVIELDVEKGYWNPQFLMIASAVLEWVRKLAYSETLQKGYQIMVEEASRVPPGSGGLLFLPSFFPESGPTARFSVPGAIIGLGLASSRSQIYRAALEGLSCQLRLATGLVEEAFDMKLRGIRIVGGGSKNELWNQIRANITGKRISVSRFAESTVLGAALTAFKGIGVFKTLDEAKKSLDYRTRFFSPSENREIYEKIYKRYLEAYKALSTIYAKKK